MNCNSLKPQTFAMKSIRYVHSTNNTIVVSCRLVKNFLMFWNQILTNAHRTRATITQRALMTSVAMSVIAWLVTLDNIVKQVTVESLFSD